MSEDSKQKAWLEHYQRLLNIKFDWEPDNLSDKPTVEGLPNPITTDTVKKAISKMKAGKALDPSGIVVQMIRAAGDTGTSMICDLAAVIIGDGKVPSNWEQSFIVCIYKGKGDALDTSQADRAGHESPGEESGQPHQTVGVNWRFPVWLRHRQRHNRCNLYCQATVWEVSNGQQETLHGFCKRRLIKCLRRSSGGHWQNLVWRSRLCDWCRDVCQCAEPCPCWWRVQWRVWSEVRCSPRLGMQPVGLHHCAWILVMWVPL